MKKLSKKRKIFLIKRSLKIINKRRKRKNKRYKGSAASDGIKRRFVEVVSPTNLTLKYEDSDEVLKFIQTIKEVGKKGYPIDLKLKNVETIAEGAISLLLSVISDLEKENIYLKGEKPDNLSARNILERSGFFKHMHGQVSSNNLVSKNKILKKGKQDTDQKELVPEIHKAMETIWGVNARCPTLYGGLGEMMRNSCDHAFPKDIIEEDVDKDNIIWHLGISHFEEEKYCKFSFVDNGLGIIKTYEQKGFFKNIKNFFNDNADILDTAFKNGIKSRTGLSWRGKGLPTIFEMYSDNIITNLIVITNNVYLDFDRDIFKTIKTSFSGTYYFWKIDTTCEPHYFTE